MVGIADFTTCPACGAFIEAGEGPTHDYIGAPPGCWKMYGVVLAREYTDFANLELTHMLTVDAYAAQHPGVPGRRQQQSVSLHLLGLYLSLEKGATVPERKDTMQRLVGADTEYPWLAPPRLNKIRNIVDVARTTTRADHERVVREWAEAVWGAWAPHHEYIRALVEQPAT